MSTATKTRLGVGLALAMIAWCGYVEGQTNVTIGANTKRSIGGRKALDRAQYFNHWGQSAFPQNTNLGDLQSEVYSPSGLHSFSGRETNDLWNTMMMEWNNYHDEDLNNPGFFDHADLVSKLQNNTNSWGYKYRTLQGNGWESLREAENPIYVTSGRKYLYPDWMDGVVDGDEPGNLLPAYYEGYADMVSVYLEEVVYGTGPGQGYLPFDKDRFYVEVINEPQWHSERSWSEMIELHRTVTEVVKEDVPQAKIGGASCCGRYNSSNDGWDMAKQMMDDMTTWQTASGQSVEMDFWSIHPYERYALKSGNVYEQDIFFSPSHLTGTMDLFESYSNQLFGDPKAFAVTEYGSWQQLRSGGSFSSYPRDLQQWDLIRNVREKLMVFMQRPDRIINATPFLSPKHWDNVVPTPESVDNVMWEQDASGDWHETIVASMYRMYKDLRGEYIEIDSDNIDVQTAAFRDGDKLYVVLNNLEKTSESLNLSALLAGGGNVTGASIDRIHRTGGVNIFEQGVDVTSSWQNLTLAPEEGAVLTLTLDGPQLYDIVKNQVTYYGDAVTLPLDGSGNSPDINISANTDSSLQAQVRVAFTRQGHGLLGEGFDIIVNGHTIAVPATGVTNYDDNDTDIVTRTVEVPLSMLNNGDNTVAVDFVGSGGELISAVMIVDHSIGDFNGSGVFDTGDIDLLLDQFGTVTPGSEYDLAGDDGIVDISDVEYWLRELRGAQFNLLGDFNNDGTVSAADYTVWRDAQGATNESVLNANGDSFGTVDATDYALWKANFGNTIAILDIGRLAVPEPAALVLAAVAILSTWSRHQSRRVTSQCE